MNGFQIQKLAKQTTWEKFCETLENMKVEETADQVLNFLEYSGKGKSYGYRKGQITKPHVEEKHNNVPNITYVTNNYYINIVVNINYSENARRCIRECETPVELYQYLEKQEKHHLTNKVIKDHNLFDGQMLKEGAMVTTQVAAKTVNVFVKVFWTLATAGMYVLYHTLKGTASVVTQPIAKQIGYSTEPVNKEELKGLPSPFQRKIENNEIIDVEIV